MITITVRPGKLTPRGQLWEALVDGVVLVRSRTPFFAVARELAKRGVHPDTVLEMKHAGERAISMKGTVSFVSQLTVWDPPSETMRVARFKERF